MVCEVVDEVDSFKYLGSVLQKNSGFYEDIMHIGLSVDGSIRCFMR